jgi:hypothetical protein
MAHIEVPDPVASKINLLAKAWQVTPGQAVGRLIEEFESDLQDEAGAKRPLQPQIAVHAEYQGTRIEGVFDRTDRSLAIVSGPAAGRRFNTPSAAAIAVVTELNPAVNPNRNGWGFWTVTETGSRLQSVRY